MSWKVLAVLLVCAALYMIPTGLTGIDVYDEGIRLHGAERVYSGDVPYHDFYAIYGPATFYWTAGLFKLFGVQVLSFRMGLILFNALAATAVFAFCRKMNVSMPGALLAYVFFLLPRQYSYDLLACDPSVSLVLWAGVVLVDAESRWASIFSGILLGCAALFRQDFGAYGTFAAVMACCFRGSPEIHSQSVKKVLSQIGWLLTGLLVSAGLCYGILAVVDWNGLLTNLVAFPAKATYYRRHPFSIWSFWRAIRAVPRTISPSAFMSLLRLPVDASPFLLAIIGLPLVVANLRRRLVPAGTERAGLAFLIFLIPGFAIYGFGRSDWPHLFPLYVLAVLLLTIVVHWFWIRSLQDFFTPRLYRWVAAMACALAVLIAAGSLKVYLSAAPLPFERAYGIVSDGDDYDWLESAVKDLSSETGPIFVAGERHDRVYINAMLVYFLAGKPSAVYFEQFDPGLTTTEEAQARIIRDLEQNHVKTIFVWRMKLPDENNLSSKSSGVLLLDSYLTNSYEQVKSEKSYRILRRRS